MKYISHTDSPFAVAHFPGDARNRYSDIIDEIKEQDVTVPSGIDIISVITADTIEESPLNYQLEKSGVEYINPLTDKQVIWNAVDKIKYIIEALDSTDAEYAYIIDGADAVVSGDLSQGTDALEYYGVDILFNASTWMFPPVLVDYVPNRGSYGSYNYLNAGVCFGKVDALKDFYAEIQTAIEQSELAHDERTDAWKGSSEQYWVRKIFDAHQDTVFFDHECRLFQVFHATTFEQVDDETVRVI